MNLDIVIKKLLLWLPKNTGAFLGVVQPIIQLVREIAILLVRLVCPLLSFGTDGKTDDRVIQQIADIADRIDKFIESLKNKLLNAGESSS